VSWTTSDARIVEPSWRSDGSTRRGRVLVNLTSGTPEQARRWRVGADRASINLDGHHVTHPASGGRKRCSSTVGPRALRGAPIDIGDLGARPRTWVTTPGWHCSTTPRCWLDVLDLSGFLTASPCSVRTRSMQRRSRHLRPSGSARDRIFARDGSFRSMSGLQRPRGDDCHASGGHAHFIRTHENRRHRSVR